MKSIAFKLRLANLLPLVVLVVFAILIVAGKKTDLMNERKLKTRHLVEAAYGVLDYYHQQEKQGVLSGEGARKAAAETVKALRYENAEYFWINDLGVPVPKMVMHPTVPSLDGKVLDAAKFNCATSMQEGINGRVETTDGKMNLFVAFNTVVNKAGHGYVTYLWPKPKQGGGATDEIFPKMSYVKKFEPWGWVIGSGIYIDDIDALYWKMVWSFSLIVLLIGAALYALSTFIARSIAQPIADAARGMGEIEVSGDLRRRLPETGGVEAVGIARAFNKLVVDQFEKTEAILARLQSAKDAVDDANQGLASLLDNSGQGFLSFGADLVIDAQYSLACETMLGGSPAGRNAADVFFHDDIAKSKLFNTIISSVLDESDLSTRENMLSLLPVEIQHNDVILKAEYKTLENGKFMVILTDITEERRMAAMLQSERCHLELIVMAVSDSRNFFDTIDAFREFLAQGLPHMLNGTAAPKILVKELYREIHTYKGLLNQFSFPSTPKVLHDIETHLSNLLSLDNTLTRKMIAEIVSPDILQAPFDKDIAVLSEALGEEFLAHGENIILSGDQALQLEKIAIRLLRGEAVDASVAEIRTLLNEIVILRKVSFVDALMGFDGLVRQMAERMEKEVSPIEVKGGGDVWIDPYTYRPFLRSLVHVFRNSVAHGIESPDARWEAEKDEAGKITCSVTVEGNTIKLTIADDGAGINLDALRQRVVAAGICNATEAADMADDEVAKFIFMDNISTQKEVTELAGRGVGLAAVMNETKNMGGEVMVKTVAGQGTEFLFTLPLHQGIQSEEV